MGHDRPDLTGPDCVQPRLVNRLSVPVKEFLRYAPQNEHIVVKIYKVLRQFRDPVDEELNRMGTESRKIVGRNVVGVSDVDQLLRVRVQPGRDVPAGHKIDLVDPRREFLHPPEPVSKRLPVPVSRFAVVHQKVIFRRVALSQFSPLRVAVIHPQYYEVNGVIRLICFRHVCLFSRSGAFRSVQGSASFC